METDRTPGLSVRDDYIDEREQAELLRWLDARSWRPSRPGRVQRFGVRPRWRAHPPRSIGQHREPPVPRWADRLDRRMRDDGLLDAPSDLVVAHDYDAGVGRGAHVDSVVAFGPRIATLNLLARAVLELQPVGDADEPPTVVALAPRSLIVMSGPARYHHTHAIAVAQLSDPVRRVSITFRTVLPPTDGDRGDA